MLLTHMLRSDAGPLKRSLDNHCHSLQRAMPWVEIGHILNVYITPSAQRRSINTLFKEDTLL